MIDVLSTAMDFVKYAGGLLPALWFGGVIVALVKG